MNLPKERDREAHAAAGPTPVAMTSLKEAFREALIAHIKTYRVSAAEVARGAGVSKEALYALTQRKTVVPGVDLALAVSAYFGKPVEEFIGFTRDSREARIATYVAMLSDDEKEFLESQLEHRIAQKNRKSNKRSAREP